MNINSLVNKLSYYQILLVYNFVLYFVFLDKKFKMSSNCFFPRSRTVCEHPYDLLANHSHTLLLGLLGNRGKFDSILHFLQRIIKKFGLFNCAIQHTYKNYVFTHDFHAKVDVNVLTHFAGEPIFYVRMYCILQ